MEMGVKLVFMVCVPIQVAFEGCCHGELDTIYATLKLLEVKENKKIDLLVCCGDFQVRAI